MKLLVSLNGRRIACSARTHGDRRTDRQTDRQTDKPSTVTLAAHACRGLITMRLKLNFGVEPIVLVAWVEIGQLLILFARK